MKVSDHISPVLCQLHWLPVRQRMVSKIATLVYQSLSSLAPGYLADNCQLVTDARERLLHSADTRTLTVHRTSSCFGDRTFAAATTRVWNSLPADLRNAELSVVSRFRRSLKTFLFQQSDHGALWTFLFQLRRVENIRTYLLTYFGDCDKNYQT